MWFYEAIVRTGDGRGKLRKTRPGAWGGGKEGKGKRCGQGPGRAGTRGTGRDPLGVGLYEIEG